jgi:hypothetical protein
MASYLYEGTSPSSTPAHLQAWPTPAQPGARPWKVGSPCGASEPALTRPQQDGSRAFNQVAPPLPIKHGCFPIKHGRFPIKHGRSPIKQERFPIKQVARGPTWLGPARGGPEPAGFKWRLASVGKPLPSPPRPSWRRGAPLRTPERSPGKLGASCGASKPSPTRLQSGDVFALSTRSGAGGRGLRADEDFADDACSCGKSSEESSPEMLWEERRGEGQLSMPLLVSCAKKIR